MSRAEAVTAARARDAAPLFAALGDETRYRLLARLSSDGPGSTASLGASSQVSRQAITKHLGVLADAGLVRSSRDGRDRIWELVPARLTQAQQHLDRISQQWDDALDRLKKLVEEE
ncbi:MAG: metalloregulator ArsR/SmtB family transcription factor [Byssovorax sp.]